MKDTFNASVHEVLNDTSSDVDGQKFLAAADQTVVQPFLNVVAACGVDCVAVSSDDAAVNFIARVRFGIGALRVVRVRACVCVYVTPVLTTSCAVICLRAILIHGVK